MFKKSVIFLFLFLFLIIVSFISLMYSGIKIDSFSFSNFSISQFYIKIDKRIILDVENIEYKSDKQGENNSIDSIKKDLELFPTILKLFQSIHIESLKINDNQFKILFDNDDLYLDNKYVNIASKINVSSNQISLDLYSLYLKDADILFDGKVIIDYFDEKINYIGDIYYQDIQTNLNLEMTKKLAKFYLQSKPFKSLKFIKPHLELSEIAEAWMYDNVEGDIVLRDFYGEFDLEKNQILENTLKGNAQILGAKIRFHNDVDVVDTKSVDVSFKNDTLHFDLIEPKFKGKDIQGSYVTIHNLTSEAKGEVEVFIKADSKLDNDIQSILKAYEINLPLTQKTGNTKAELTLKIPYLEALPMSTKGNFKISDSQIFINTFPFYSNNAEVVLTDSIVEVKNADFKHKDMIDAFINSLTIDTNSLKSSGDVLLNSFSIKNGKDSIVNITNKQMPINMDFGKDTIIELKDLETNIKISDLVYVDIKNLSKIYPYSKLLKDISIKDGNLSLEIKDDKNIKFKTFVKGLDFPIEKNGVKVSELNLNGLIENKNVYISNIEEDLKVEITDNTKLYLSNYDLIVDSNKDKGNLNKNLNIYLNNSKLKLDGNLYHLESAEIFLKNGQIDFITTVRNLDIPLLKDGKKIEELSLKGLYKNDNLKLNTLGNDLILELKDNCLSLYVENLDVVYDSKELNNEHKNLDVVGKNSNIIINNRYKFLADNYQIRIREDSQFINLKYKDTDILIKESKDKKIDIFANNLSDEFINTIFNKKVVSGGKFLLLANGNINNLNGKVIIENSNIEDLAILNNLLLFIHASPALVNPFLAIPSVIGMATNSGFNLTAYKVVNGSIEFNYLKEKELLDIKKLVTVGNGIDFDGKGKVDLSNLTLESEVKLIFLKDYSKIVGSIPVINYVLLGENKRVETEVNIFGELANPKISTNLTKETFSLPVNIAKRILSSPNTLLDFIKDKNEVIRKEEENMINKPLN